MKINKNNYETVKSAIIESLERFIKYTEEVCSSVKWLLDDIKKYEVIFQKLGKEGFEQKYNIDLKEAYKDKRYLELLPSAKIMMENLDNLHVKFVETVLGTPEEPVYPIKCVEWVRKFDRYCIDNGKFLSVIEQNDRLNSYVHFPMGDKNGKRSKTFGDFGEGK